MPSYWKTLRCDGCPVGCRYADFKVFPRDGFQQTQQSLFVASEDPDDWRYKRRGTVLGLMHQTKRELWEQATAFCENSRVAIELRLGPLSPVLPDADEVPF